MTYTSQLKRHVVLIVEDDRELRKLVVDVFEETSLEIVECESAEAALAVMLIRGEEVVLILSDIRLSGAMDGVDFAREAKIRWPHLSIIVTSGNAGKRITQLPPGIIYMPKPWNPSVILKLAEQAFLTSQKQICFRPLNRANAWLSCTRTGRRGGRRDARTKPRTFHTHFL